MNISWETKYKTANLYLVQGANYNDPVALTLNTAATWHEWRVGYPTRDDTKPFVLRLVNAQGSSDDMAVGGIWSARFWIGWDQDASSSSTLTPTPTPTGVATVTDGLHGDATTSASPTSSSEAKNESSSHGKNLGIGIGVGLGVPLCGAVIVAVLFLWKRRNQHKSVVHDGPFARPAPDKSCTNLAVPEDMFLEGKRAYELSGESSRKEADSSHVRYELA
ncbi:hypothetical protein BDV38DRAFT_281577 [Aspergillus pseudotamarii]|uniref:Mid2 domain-containing protein n=1 Tax=Aspergillus pseudotamarii TaxID=132259 RepID=A0A5N6SWF4_ASPPS|nr:uncharacterized protein BDV38DRAFT_281577 [Aspergillus pseudotamarii]KAE8139016.1 hypothetical protein BDV38DRAFT_281577 [Aspergillus pseudotamarii]